MTLSTSRSNARAQVQWVSETEAGGTFIDELNVEAFDSYQLAADFTPRPSLSIRPP